MLPEVARDTVVNLLERKLPGLTEFAATSHAEARAHMTALWARSHPDRPPPGGDLPLAAYVLHPDHILDHAKTLGFAVTGRPVAEDDMQPAVIAALAELVDDPLLIVTDTLGCHLAPGSALIEHTTRGEFILDGDVIIVATISPRVIVVHHESWLFELRLV